MCQYYRAAQVLSVDVLIYFKFFLMIRMGYLFEKQAQIVISIEEWEIVQECLKIFIEVCRISASKIIFSWLVSGYIINL